MTPVTAVIITKENYAHLIRNNNSRREKKLLDELKNLPLFKSFTNTHLRKVID